jgi:hypothetical protein
MGTNIATDSSELPRNTSFNMGAVKATPQSRLTQQEQDDLVADYLNKNTVHICPTRLAQGAASLQRRTR